MPSKKSQKQQATRERSARNKGRREANEARLKAKRQRASELGSRSRKAVDAETRAKPAKKATLTPNQRQKARAAARRIEPSAADLDAATNRAQLNLEERIDQHLESSPARAIFANQSRTADLPAFAICGRPNVGKSTLFNRLTGSRRSIVGDEPGITRDRIYGEVEWAGRTARLIDTGGIVPDDPNLIPAEIFRQARAAFDEAQLIVMVVDGRTEIAAPDIELARLLIRSGKPVFLVVNKIDTDQLLAQAENFRRLGVQALFPISAEHGSGIGDLLEAVFDTLKFPEQEQEEIPAETAEQIESESHHRTHGEYQQRETSIAIIGRPNVGKSTLLNALTNSSRAIVSPIAGTTRDAVDEVVEHNGAQYRFVDTAGIRRKGKTHLMAEKLSVIMARRHLEAADVACSSSTQRKASPPPTPPSVAMRTRAAGRSSSSSTNGISSPLRVQMASRPPTGISSKSSSAASSNTSITRPSSSSPPRTAPICTGSMRPSRWSPPNAASASPPAR